MQSEAMKQEEIEALAREMAKGVKTEPDLEAVMRTLTKTLIETALKAEMTDHLGYEAHDRSGTGSGNSRNDSRERSNSYYSACTVGIERISDNFGSILLKNSVW